MKLFRFGSPDHEHPGVVLPTGQHIDVTHFGEDYDESFFASNGPERLAHWLDVSCSDLPRSCRRMNALVRVSNGRPKLCALGLNYAKHAAETNSAHPAEPILFFKSTTALCGPDDNVVIPKRSEKTDWEVELAIIIGKRASYVELDEAMDYIAGYALHNDYSERAWQLERGRPMGKRQKRRYVCAPGTVSGHKRGNAEDPIPLICGLASTESSCRIPIPTI